MKNRRGFSLFETLLYVALLAVITTVLMTYMINMVGREAKIATMLEVNQNARFAMEKITATIRASKDATAPTDGGGTGSVLSLTMPDNTVTSFQVTNGSLTMIKNGGTAVPITSSAVAVSSLTFTNLVDPTAHKRTSPAWQHCDNGGSCLGWTMASSLCCRKSDQTDQCYNLCTAIWNIYFARTATWGSCLQATASKSVIRVSMTISSPASAGPGNNFHSSVTLYDTVTIPRQN